MLILDELRRLRLAIETVSFAYDLRPEDVSRLTEAADAIERLAVETLDGSADDEDPLDVLAPAKPRTAQELEQVAAKEAALAEAYRAAKAQKAALQATQMAAYRKAVGAGALWRA